MSNYSKEKLANDFVESYKELGEKRKAEFTEICFKLLNENYIYGQKKEERDLYYLIDSFKDVVQNYFNIIDYELAQDDFYKIFYLKSINERASLKFKKIESIILLLLRKFYYVKIKEINSDVNISVTYDELLEEINKTHIYKDRLNKTEISDSLKILKKYKIVDFDSKQFAMSDALIIYPTILFAVGENDLKSIEMILKEYRKENTNNENDED